MPGFLVIAASLAHRSKRRDRPEFGEIDAQPRLVQCRHCTGGTLSARRPIRKALFRMLRETSTSCKGQVCSPRSVMNPISGASIKGNKESHKDGD
jgi:hypothetical protein